MEVGRKEEAKSALQKENMLKKFKELEKTNAIKVEN